MAKKVKRKRKQKGGSFTKIDYHGRKIFLVASDHKTQMPIDLKKHLFDLFDHYNKICFLVEEDYTLLQKDIMIKQKFNEPNTKLIVNELKNMRKKCINGWDIRPKLLGRYQNNLYGKNSSGEYHFNIMTFDLVWNKFINKAPRNQIYKELFEFRGNRISKIDWNNTPIKDLIKNNIISAFYAKRLMNSLREDFKNITDNNILKIIKESDKNLIIIAGNAHIKNLKILLSR